MNETLTSVAGIQVGHATASGGRSGCTVILGPFRSAVDIRGLATGTREMEVLAPEHLVPRVDALLLTGGSAFGLDAADGVMAWLAERGRGFDTGEGTVPIVPTAVIFDLSEGCPVPSRALGREACEDAGEGPVAEGRVGAGAGATVGKIAGRQGSSPGGVGTWAADFGGWRVAALAVVNALGDVLDGDGRVVAGCRDAAGRLIGGESLLTGVGGDMKDLLEPRTGGNTTLAVVATDAPLGRVDLVRLARMVSTALPRRITPVHTPFDGDVVFAASTAAAEAVVSPGELLGLGVAGRRVLEEAITRGVTAGGVT